MTENGNAIAASTRGDRRASTGLYVRGSRALRLRDQRVRKLVQRMRAAMPWLEDSDLPTCRAWAELEVLATRVYAELRDGGVINRKGEARRLLDDYRKLRQAQLAYARELGMTPAARMAIKASGTRVPLDLAAAMANGDVEDVSDGSEEKRAGNGPR